MDIALAQGVAHELANTVDDSVVWLSGIMGVIFLAIAIALLVLVIWAIISTLVDSDLTAGGKLLWIIFELWTPLLGAVAWLVVGRKGHLNRLLGIDKGRARHSVPSSVGQHSNVAGRSAAGAPQPPAEQRPQSPGGYQDGRQDQAGLGNA
ncbi:PLD nuclease N-terminal domain-containing protein [Nocardiopsis sp. YSL2]|uniref:PLD nuclease N-terminal domain-containing protein n=1 Tax=Nocardiopsis sp. YSL2 TaxID=2939492 RepID=UPI0026F43748|nr:PLD nuclease N-terminal domain-containing protein [Nocardiopsis sp. YSL2]